MTCSHRSENSQVNSAFKFWSRENKGYFRTATFPERRRGAKVCKLDIGVRMLADHENILRLQIAMHDSIFVSEIQNGSQYAANHGCLIFRKEILLLYSAEKATWMAGEAIQILGGNGYINEYPVGRLWRDAKLYEIGAGTSEIRRMLIGRELFAETK